jgi:hypothetical protein
VSENKWEQPEAPPPPLFTGKKEKDLVKQVTDEVIERVIGTSILYYPVSLSHSNYHSLYGESINKTFLPPVKVDVLAEWEGEETTSTGFGIDKKSTVVIHFHKRRLTEDQNLFVREGDFIQYGEQKYEIVTLGQPRQLFGQPDAKIEIVARCTRARDGNFPVEEPSDADDDPRLTAPACDPVHEIRVLTGDNTSTGGTGTQPCGEEYERPGTPPPPLFTGAKETALVKQVSDEILERVVGQQVVYFPVSVPHSNFHELYGESVNKTFLPPLRVFASIDWKGSDTDTTSYGIDRKSAIDVKFHKRRLVEDQNLFVREGDFVLYGKILYEITKISQPRLLFGKIDEKFEVIASCVRAREGTFRLSEIEGQVNDFELDSVTACDNANLLIPDGVDNTMSNVGTGEGMFKNKTGIQFNMKTLKAGENIIITDLGDEIEIQSSGEISGTITNAHTASYVETAQTASYVETAQTASLALTAHTASYVETAQTASYVETAQTASYYAETDTLSTVVARGSDVSGSITVTGSMSLTDTLTTTNLTASNVELRGHTLPDQNSTYDLGSPTKQFRHLYVSSGSIWFGGKNRFQVDEGGIKVQKVDTRKVPKQLHTLHNITDQMVIDHFAIGSMEDMTVDNWIEYAEFFDVPEFDLFNDDDDFEETLNFAANDPGVSGSGGIFGGTALTASYIEAANVEGLHELLQLSETGLQSSLQNVETTLQSQIDDLDTQYTNLSMQVVNIGAGGGGGAAVAGIGSGILTLTDDGDGPNRALLYEYTTNPVAYSGKTLYLANVAENPVGPFAIGSKFYFNEGGVWHPSHFYSDQVSNSQSAPAAFPDMQDILKLDASRSEDYAVLMGLHHNSASYGGRAIYLSNTGSVAVGEFIYTNKYYFNEGGMWHVSVFHSEED